VVIIAQGDSPFFDERGKSLCKFRMWSAYVDDVGDRYGVMRAMKGPQDAINQHRSKAMHIMNTRQIKLSAGAVADIEAIRKEAAKPDGVLVTNGNPDTLEVIQPAQEFLQQTQYFQDAKDEIENFGPNQALLGTNMSAKSGRALNIMREGGLAELGPFLKNCRSWKLDAYKQTWSNTKRYTTAEKTWRISGDDKAAQFIQINQTSIDEYGNPIIVNQLARIDVEIRIEEGPDTETIMGDTFDVLQTMGQNGVPVPPEVIIEMAQLPTSTKEKLIEMLKPKPDPVKEQAQMALMQQEVEKAQKLNAETMKLVSEVLLNQQKLQMAPVQMAMDAQSQMPQQDMVSPQQQQPMQQPMNAQLPMPGPMEAQMPPDFGPMPMDMGGGMQQQMPPIPPMQQPAALTIRVDNEKQDQMAMLMAQNQEVLMHLANQMAGTGAAVADAANSVTQVMGGVAQSNMAVAQAMEKLSAPRRVVRDPKTQRAIGVELAQ
jgi:hypothetical protein